MFQALLETFSLFLGADVSDNQGKCLPADESGNSCRFSMISRSEVFNLLQ